MLSYNVLQFGIMSLTIPSRVLHAYIRVGIHVIQLTNEIYLGYI